MDESCSFCIEASTGFLFDPILEFVGMPPFERRVWENEHFFIVPSLGPLGEVHALVVSKSHYHSLRDAPTKIIFDAIDIAKRLGRSISRKIDNVVLFENGTNLSLGARESNTCVDHLHVHVLAFNGAPIMLEECLLDGGRPVKIDEFINIEKSTDYIIFSTNLKDFNLIFGDDLPRQYIRSIFAKKLHDDDVANWRDAPSISIMRQHFLRIKEFIDNDF